MEPEVTKVELESYIKMIDCFITENHVDYLHFLEVKIKLQAQLNKMKEGSHG